MKTKLAIENINTEAGTQVRVELDEERVESYAAAMQRGEELPPIHVFQREGDSTYILSDGYHRLAAARKLGKTEVEVKVHVGDRRDAVLLAIEANTRHGLGLTKKQAVTFMLKNSTWAKWSNMEIARSCGCDESYVRKVEKKLTSDSVRRKRRRLVRRRGKVREMNTTAIGQAAQSEPVSEEPDAGRAVLAEVVQSTEQEPKGEYKVIVVNTPWDRMSAENIGRFPVGDLAAPDSVLWLRADNAHLADAVAALKQWGFRYATKLTYMRESCDKQMMTCHTEDWLGAVRGAAEIEPSMTGFMSAEDPIATICDVAEQSAPIHCRKLMMFAEANVEGWESLTGQLAA